MFKNVELKFLKQVLRLIPVNFFWKDKNGYCLGCNYQQLQNLKLNTLLEYSDLVAKKYRMKKQFSQSIETKRLVGSIPSLNDLDEYCCMMQNKQFIDCYGIAFNREVLYERVISDINHWQQHGFGMWLWRDKENKGFVGRAGLKSFILDNKNEIELGYAIKPEYWGKGIAVEMSLMAIELAFNTLFLPQLICFTRTQNDQSLRVMQKLRFYYEKDFIYLDMPHKLYRLNASL